MLLVNTRNGSEVIAKIAGTESTANIKSEVSIMIRAKASGVKQQATLRRDFERLVVSVVPK